MNYLPQLLPLVGVWVIVLITPGPDVLVTAQYATARSRRDGVLVGLGITSAIGVWASASLLGLAVLLARVSWLYDTVRLAGAAYLGYLGVRALLAVRRAGPAEAAVEHAGADVGQRSAWAVWRVGFLTNIGNPKAAVFFGSLFTAFLPPHPELWLQAAVVGVMLLMATAWFTAVACLFSLAPIARGYRRAKRGIDALTGCLFVALAGRLATE
ncbi:LysE family translocator [Streptomyces sp. XD-27]|uniref:LysE family translocator n=1 Tax=Streptomyces sp. XD-27 TaxID=3062779 RepID=UPI0026F426E6|nr:LysE family transporter [Streptomyces sp. XD-27]WKX73659.1 LysE family transporter [Streptomyces sp. XD-27]